MRQMRASPFPKPSDRRRQRENPPYLCASICQEKIRDERDRLIAFFQPCHPMTLYLHPPPGRMATKARNKKHRIEAGKTGEDVEAAGSATIDPSCTYLSPLAITSSTPSPIHPYQPSQRGPWHTYSSSHAPGNSIKDPPPPYPRTMPLPVSYTHLTLPTICSV